MNQDKIREMENLIARDYSNTAGIAVMKDGTLVYENYFSRCTEASRIHVFSVTKSIVSVLFGIALDKGLLDSTERKVLDFYPDYTVKKGDKTIQNITIHDILTMTAPYKFRFNPYVKYFTSPDWVKYSLDTLGGKRHTGEFRYAPIIGPDILSGILVKATGMSVLDFAKEKLFKPLGINVGESIIFRNKDEQMSFYKATDISGWVADPKGINTAGWGLTLSPVDMVQVGQMLLNGGIWNGKRIVSEKWISESTSEHSRWKKLDIPYGYLWWLDRDGDGFAAMGDGGNIIHVNTKKNLVVAITCLFVPHAKDRIDFIKEYIEPAFDE